MFRTFFFFFFLQLSRFTLDLLFLGKRNPIKIKLEGEREGWGRDVIQDSRNTSFLPQVGMHLDLITGNRENYLNLYVCLCLCLSISPSLSLTCCLISFSCITFAPFSFQTSFLLSLRIQSSKMCSSHPNACLSPQVYRTSQAQLL